MGMLFIETCFRCEQVYMEGEYDCEQCREPDYQKTLCIIRVFRFPKNT